MGLQNIYLISGFFFCLIAATVAYSLIKRRHSDFTHFEIIIFIPVLLTAISYAALAWNDFDIVSNLSRFGYLAPLAVSVILILTSFCHFHSWQIALIILGLAALVLIGFNLSTPLDAYFPRLANQLLIAVIWTIFCLTLKNANSSSGIVNLHIICSMIGITILFFLNAVPFALGFEAVCVTGAALAFLLFNWPPAILKLTDNGAVILAFFSGGILVYAGLESSFASVLILVMLPLCEIVFAIFAKLTFNRQAPSLKTCTACSLAINSGLEPGIVAKHVFRINLLMILFACFQVYAPNQFSVPLICAVVVCWQMYRLAHWNSLSSGLADINRTVIAELKQNYSNIKETLTKLTSQPSDRTDKKD